MFRKCLLFIFLIFTSLYSSDACIDIIKTTAQRTQQYPLKKYKKISVCAPCRTGSTLVYNVCRFLFENLEALEHPEWEESFANRIVEKPIDVPSTLQDKTVLLLSTIRNPIDTCFSHYRCEVIINQAEGIHEPSIELAVQDYVSNMSKLKLLSENNSNVLIFKYEDFNGDFESLFNLFEKAFGIKIHPKDRSLMEIMFCKESIVKYSKQFQSFVSYDPRTHIHGNHIDLGEIPNSQKNSVKAKITEKLSIYKNSIKQWGYEL